MTGYYSTHFPHISPPYVREATAHFARKGKHYLITSGTTGYLPNPSEIAVADTWHGPYTVLGNPHRNDQTQTSFHSQISSVFKVPGKKDLYIACADRWRPDKMDLPYECYREIYERMFSEDPKEREAVRRMDLSEIADRNANTAEADYVWLPLHFEDDMVYIDWKDEWRIEDYE